MIDYVDFSRKCAVVTGGRRGLVREITIELAERQQRKGQITRAVAKLGQFDILVNNGGFMLM